VVLLVDGDRFFQGAQPAAPAPMRWLVVDPERRGIELSPQATTDGGWRDDAPSVSPEVADLLARMGAGAAGTMPLGRPAAAALGLGRRTAVAAWAPVPLLSGGPWSVGAVVSARRVRDRARLAAWRLGAATGLTGLLVSLFGVALARQQRRAQSLAAALGLAEATAALRERSEKLVEAIPIGVLALDAARRVTAVNPYLAQRGVRAEVPLAEALAHHDELATLEALVSEAHQTRRPATRPGLRMRLGVPPPLAGDDAHPAGGELNEPRDVDAYAVPLGRPLADADCFLVLHDRTEIRVLERNLQRAEKLATIGTLAAGVAHEVGTPLGIISGRAEQLLGKLPGGNGNEPARKAVTSILAQVDKVSTTIRQLLDFARVRPIEATAVTPAQLLGQVAALLEHRFRHARVALAVDAPPSVDAVTADPGQLEQVLVNLLINACDACAAGGHVTVRARPDGGRVLFEIADDGVGIAPEHLSSVLDPFFTTKKRGQGTGLGLTIAADIVKNHGGTLEIDSTIGAGTTVRVRLPIAEAKRAQP
jgi:signal transduction histidine kinase